MTTAPHELHQDLTNERIDIIGHLIARVRLENIESSDCRDTGWSLGCRAYAWCCQEVILLKDTTAWLDVIDPSLKFIFSIGQVEVSFYKGPSTKPKKNIYSRAQSYPEIRQLSLLSDIEVPEKLIWVYAVETDKEGLTTNIEFFGMSEFGEIIASRQVPIHTVKGAAIVGIDNQDAPAAVLPAASVSLPGKKGANDDNERQNNISR